MPGEQLLAEGEFIDFEIDAQRRINLSRRHTLTHVVMASIRRCIDDYHSRGAEVHDDGETCSLWFASHASPSDRQLAEIEALSKAAIDANFPVSSVNEKSVDVAQAKYSAWRVDGTLGLSGKVRAILIGDDWEAWDANPCSGTHVKSTAEIGPFTIDGVNAVSGDERWEMRLRIGS